MENFSGEVAELRGGRESEAGGGHVRGVGRELVVQDGHFAGAVFKGEDGVGVAEVFSCADEPGEVEGAFAEDEVFVQRDGSLPDGEARGAAVDAAYDAKREVAVEIVADLGGANGLPADVASVPIIWRDCLDGDEARRVVSGFGAIAEN